MAIPELLKTIALNRLVDQGVRRIDRFYGTDTDRDDEDEGFGFVSQQKPGGLGSIIGRALAFSLLGPIAGPLAFAAGKGILSRQQQGLGFSPFGGDGGDGPTGPDITRTLTQEEIYDRDDVDPADYGLVDAATADIQDFADIMPEDTSSDSGGDSYDGASSAEEYSADPTSFSGSFRYGGLASLYR